MISSILFQNLVRRFISSIFTIIVYLIVFSSSSMTKSPFSKEFSKFINIKIFKFIITFWRRVIISWN